MKFQLGDSVLVVGPECKAILHKTGIIVERFEQEPNNYYYVEINRRNYTVFENEIQKG